MREQRANASDNAAEAGPVAASLAFEDGDFMRSRMGQRPLVHIAVTPGPNDPTTVVRSACGRLYVREYMLPANGDEPRQCSRCWESM